MPETFTSSVIYKDPKAALDWLAKAFGFELAMLIDGPDGDDSQIHSEMTMGEDGLIYVGGEWSAWVKSPLSVGGVNTQRITVHLAEDIDAHCERARAAGAVITQEPADQPYGARVYLAVDPEGHEWDFSRPLDKPAADLQREMAEAGMRVDAASASDDYSTCFPQAFYADAKAAMAWLERAFGFETAMVIESTEGPAKGNVRVHMAFEGGQIALGNDSDDPTGVRTAKRSPASVGGANTQRLHVHMSDGIDAHCERARAAGAVIEMEPADQFYGDRSYLARDPDGHVWSFGQTIRDVSHEEAEAAIGREIKGWV